MLFAAWIEASLLLRHAHPLDGALGPNLAAGLILLPSTLVALAARMRNFAAALLTMVVSATEACADWVWSRPAPSTEFRILVGFAVVPIAARAAQSCHSPQQGLRGALGVLGAAVLLLVVFAGPLAMLAGSVAAVWGGFGLSRRLAIRGKAGTAPRRP